MSENINVLSKSMEICPRSFQPIVRMVIDIPMETIMSHGAFGLTNEGLSVTLGKELLQAWDRYNKTHATP